MGGKKTEFNKIKEESKFQVKKKKTKIQRKVVWISGEKFWGRVRLLEKKFGISGWKKERIQRRRGRMLREKCQKSAEKFIIPRGRKHRILWKQNLNSDWVGILTQISLKSMGLKGYLGGGLKALKKKWKCEISIVNY